MKIRSNPKHTITSSLSNSAEHLLEIGKQVLAETDVNKVLELSIDRAIELTGAERGLLILIGDHDEILFETARNLAREDIENPKFEVSRTIINQVKKKSEALCFRNALDEPLLKESPSATRIKILSVICIPLIFKNKIFGVIYLDNRQVEGVFEKDTCEFIKEFADFISLAAYNALEQKRLKNKVDKLETELRSKYRFDSIIGHHPKMLDVLKLVSQVADSNATILIQGESGTGKELVAKAIHYNSLRRDKPFIPINCGALPENLLESELFGHVKGAFTGAIKDKTGWFEQAEGGTIFLDEVSEMSPAMQVKLLRILQTGEYSKVGDSDIKFCDVRVIAATNKNLQQRVNEGKFREDVYYRLNVVEIELPPLRHRRSDIPLLVKYFLDFYNKTSDKNIKLLSPEVEAILMAYNFPGNVRELENIMLHAVTLTGNEIIEAIHLPARVRGTQKIFGEEEKPSNLQEAKRRASDKAEKEFIKECLQATSGHISKAAKLAGMDVGNFHRIMTKHEIDASVFKKSRF
ncbi:sigma 54-interacting transcriptional regulator [candidate division KSB1 bacterium]|nr:sigma 54-interacting transcriptional regulator [candidate division KSB1 bacterium]